MVLGGMARSFCEFTCTLFDEGRIEIAGKGLVHLHSRLRWFAFILVASSIHYSIWLVRVGVGMHDGRLQSSQVMQTHG